MKYRALLRGINVGGNHKVDMKELKTFFESLGHTNISTHINSGNVIFESKQKKETLQKVIPKQLEEKFKFTIPTLIKTENEIQAIVKEIPKDWQNDKKQKTDIAFLFDEIDKKETINELPIKKEFLTIKYTKGAIIWNVKRENQNKSQLSKLVSHKFYKLMTIRNVNTVRVLSGMKKTLS